jgi:hypothetical protein
VSGTYERSDTIRLRTSLVEKKNLLYNCFMKMYTSLCTEPSSVTEMELK